MNRLLSASLWDILICAFTLPAFSQPVITSFSHNGVLICSQLAPGSIATVEWTSSLPTTGQATWQELQSGTVAQDGTLQLNIPTSQATAPRFYRVRGTGWPANMALIPAGSFTMGDSSDQETDALPLHSVYISAFYIDRYEVTGLLWSEVHSWAVTNGYSIASLTNKAPNHPAHSVTWYDAVKWCNARSEKEGKTPAYYTDAELSAPYRTGEAAPYVNWNAGYRLPTEAEWEKAARGGVSGRRFAWSDVDTITHSQANYYVVVRTDGVNYFTYDVSPTARYHPTFNDGVVPYTSPVGYFAPNGYGLYDMAGNVWEWCWDWYSNTYYSSTPSSDPRGPATGSGRTGRGGGWNFNASFSRIGHRSWAGPTKLDAGVGFRVVLPPSQ